ncbi:hypothetical protein [Amycolatopsis sacchari]|uniref:hypothetical protein n=1 Tax=Amycolatopsis sacchari TaxID=115433 RepID=UPI003EBD3A1C
MARFPRIFGAVLTLASAGLLLVSSFLPLVRLVQSVNGVPLLQMDRTGWGQVLAPGPGEPTISDDGKIHSPLYGIPVLVVAVGLVLAGVLALRVGRRAALAVSAAVAGAVVVALMLGMEIESALNFNDAQPAEPSTGNLSVYSIQPGFWFVVAAAATALAAAAVLLPHRRRVETEADDEGDEVQVSMLSADPEPGPSEAQAAAPERGWPSAPEATPPVPQGAAPEPSPPRVTGARWPAPGASALDGEDDLPAAR